MDEIKKISDSCIKLLIKNYYVKVAKLWKAADIFKKRDFGSFVATLQ
jgi:hypothetical protein